MSDDLILEHILNPCGGVSKTQPDLQTPVYTEQEQKARSLEAESVQFAEGGDLQRAHVIINIAISLAPGLASLYNNRAQLRRLQGNTDGAGEDLEQALTLCKGAGPIAKQAYTQRAMLNMLFGKEEQARLDFEAAAQLGSGFAGQQAARLNPYAKLCNQMLTKAMEELTE